MPNDPELYDGPADAPATFADAPEPREEMRLPRPSWRNLETLKRAFGTDALACITDSGQRAALESAIAITGDPEGEKKKIALAAYFAFMRPEDIKMCYDHLPALLERYYDKTISVDAAFADVGKILNGGARDKGFFERRVPAAVIEGEGQVAKSTFNFAAFMGKQLPSALAATLAPGSTLIPSIRNLTDEAGNAIEQKVRGVYNEHYEPIRQWAQENMEVPEGWVSNSKGVGDWCANAAISFINYLPQLAAQTGLTVATGGVAALGVAYGINGYYDIKDDDPETDEAKALLYGLGVGLINGGLEKISFGILSGKLSKKIARDGIKKGILATAEHFGAAAVLEGVEEGAEEFAENLLDIAMGRRGDFKNWTGKEWRKELFRNVPEAAFLGLSTGGVLEVDAYRQGRRRYREIDQRRIFMRNTVEYQTAELEAKENLSPEEAAELEKLRIVRDAGSDADVEAEATRIMLREIRKQQEESETLSPDVNAAQSERLKQELPHDPEETRQTVQEAARDIRAEVETTEEWTKDDLRQQIEQMKAQHPDLTEDQCFEFLQGQIGALWKDGKVVVNINNVRPSEVAFKLRHEALLHDGIRRAFGDEAANQLFDLVWNEQEKSEGMRAILERYQMLRQKVNENGEYVFDDDGNAVYEELTQDDKRLAAEEFLAHLQETNGVPVSEIYQDHKVEIDDFARQHGMDPHDLRKENIDRITREWMAATNFQPPRPSWLKQLISRIRTWLRTHGIGVNHLSDDEILTILARAAKAEVSRRGGKNAQGNGVRYAVNNGTGARPYYDVPFAESVKNAIDPAQKNTFRSPIFVRQTPEPFLQIGFPALPMMTNVRKARLNYYTEAEFIKYFGSLRPNENAHGLHDNYLKVKEALAHPIAIVANLSQNAQPGSVMAITDIDVNGKKVIVPVVISTSSRGDGMPIDAHLILTVYDKNDWMDNVVKPAMAAEKNGVGVFYLDKEKAGRYGVFSQLKERVPSGIIHNIEDPGSPVKGVFKKQTETLQFDRYFKGSKVVDQNGDPLVVYHGTRGTFYVFDGSKSGSNLDFGTMGKGFYFTTDRQNAENIAKNNTTGNGDPVVMECFLSIKNPKEISWNEISGNSKEETERLTEKWKSKGYDGFVAQAPNGATW